MDRQTIDWLRGLAEKGGRGVVDNIDARCLGRIADGIEQLIADRERTARNRDMWKGQCERQADQLRAHVGERKAHKVMTQEEYTAMPIIGWHEVCRDVDGFGGAGVRFLGEPCP